MTEQIFINDKEHLDKPTKFRVGCRGVIIQDNKILLSVMTKEDFYLIPGGGMEDNESMEQACIREVEEETSLIVQPQKHFLTIEEYYNEWLFTSHYFTCTITGKGKFNLTQNELNRGLEPQWVDLSKAMEIFATYPQYEATDIERYGSYKREYTALHALLNS